MITPANPYHQIIDEHTPYGADTPHNLFPMDLHPTQKNSGPVRPQRVVNKSINPGNPLKIFGGSTGPYRAPPTLPYR